MRHLHTLPNIMRPVRLTGAALKASILLPRTVFPMRFSPALEVPDVTLLTTTLYREHQSSKAPLPIFRLHDGPPYANGSLHIGHFLNKVLKDMVNRWKMLSGYRVEYVPGWDCHGLPIELKALAALRSGSSSGNDTGSGSSASPSLLLTPSRIRGLARGVAEAAIAGQASDFQRWGILGDWEVASRGERGNAYVTMDPGYEAAQLRVFGALVKSGAVRRDLRPVWWSPASTTALAEAELEYNEHHTSKSVWVTFPFNASGSSTSSATPSTPPSSVLARLQELHHEAVGKAKAAAGASHGGAGGALPLLPPGISALVWTTTPWTLPSNVALAVNPELEYSVVACGHSPHSLLILATPCIPSVVDLLIKSKKVAAGGGGEGDTPDAAAPVLSPPLLTFLGKDLCGAAFSHPLIPTRTSLCIPGVHVTGGTGSGVVHTSPGHGVEDFLAVAQWNSGSGSGSGPQLPILCPVDTKGLFTEEVVSGGASGFGGEEGGGGVFSPLVGLPVLSTGSEAVIGMLEKGGVLLTSQVVAHRYPYDARSHTPVIVRTTAQWFIDTEGLVVGSGEGALQGVAFHPPVGATRLAAALGGRASWCISRQRAWGVPIPAFFNSVSGEALLDGEVVERFARAVQAAPQGTDIWWEWEKGEGGGGGGDDPLIPPHHAETARVGGFQWLRGSDTLDVWFDSGTSWAAAATASAKAESRSGVVGGAGAGGAATSAEYLASLPPNDLVVEGSDQHRGWFQSSLLTRLATGATTAPFKAVATHGFVLDEKGRKMSKSVGNVIAPGDVIDGKGLFAGGAAAGGGGGGGGGVPWVPGMGKKKRGGGKVNPQQQQPPPPPPPQQVQQKGGDGGVGGIGVDGLRYWVASSDFSKDISVGPTVLARTFEALKKVRNTARFLLGVTHGFLPSGAGGGGSEVGWFGKGTSHTHPPADAALLKAWGSPFPPALLPPPSFTHPTTPTRHTLRPLDAAFLAKLYQVEGVIRTSFDTLSFERGTHTLSAWAARDVSAIWCDAVKDRLYQEVAGGEGGVVGGRWEAQAVAWETLRVLTRALAPIAPFTAQQIYAASLAGLTSEVGGGGVEEGGGEKCTVTTTIFHTLWEPLPMPLGEGCMGGIPLLALWDHLCAIRSGVQGVLEKCRGGEGGLGSAVEAKVTLFVTPVGGEAGEGARSSRETLLKVIGLMGGGMEEVKGDGAYSSSPSSSSHPSFEATTTTTSVAQLEELVGTSGVFVSLLPPPTSTLTSPSEGLWWGEGAFSSGEGGGAYKYAIKVERAGGVEDKCARCWKYREEVKAVENKVCHRCARVTEGGGV